MNGEIGAAGHAAAQIANRQAHLLYRMLEAAGRADWPRLATALSGPGERLDEVLRRRMERLLGYDLGEARVHSGPHIEPLAAHLGADAFTIGARVFAPPGRLNPSSEHGAALLAHELTHVVQQTRPQPVLPAPPPAGAPAPPTPLPIQLAMAGGREGNGGDEAEAQAQAVEQIARRRAGRETATARAVDLTALAERVYELLKQELLLERERLGSRTW